MLKGRDGARCLYGARVIVEHVDALTRGDHWCATFDASGRMTPGDAVARAVARKWRAVGMTVGYIQNQGQCGS